MNPFALPFACPTCNDTRTITRRIEAHRPNDLIPCPKCGQMEDEEYDRFRKDAWLAAHPRPTITELDMSLDELAVMKRMRADYPKVSKLTVLSWMEGQRYQPAKDEEFLAEAREKFKEWRNR